jgi:hypothetical protein
LVIARRRSSFGAGLPTSPKQPTESLSHYGKTIAVVVVHDHTRAQLQPTVF